MAVKSIRARREARLPHLLSLGWFIAAVLLVMHWLAPYPEQFGAGFSDDDLSYFPYYRAADRALEQRYLLTDTGLAVAKSQVVKETAAAASNPIALRSQVAEVEVPYASTTVFRRLDDQIVTSRYTRVYSARAPPSEIE